MLLRFFCLLLLVFWTALPAPVGAAPQLDAGFGWDGRVAVELGQANSANAVLVQPDGKILVAGSANSGVPGNNKNFSLARFNPDGTLDASFHREGALITSVSLGDDEALALGLFADGRIVAGGYAANQEGGRDFALVCYLPDGSLDLGFGLNGVTLTPVAAGDDEITALLVAPDDKIVVAGTVGGVAGTVAAAARYDAEGNLDASFGERGVMLLGVGEESRVEGIVARADGFALSGTFRRGNQVSLMLIGLDRNGLLDASFGANGVALPDPAALPQSTDPSEGYRLASDGEGLLYVAGAVGEAGQRDTALFRFFPDGRPDPDFGRAGVVINPVSAEDDVLLDVTVESRGAVATGFASEGGRRRFLLASYALENGTLDTLDDLSTPFLSVARLEAGGKIPLLTQVAKKRPKRPKRARKEAAQIPEAEEEPGVPEAPENLPASPEPAERPENSANKRNPIPLPLQSLSGHLPGTGAGQGKFGTAPVGSKKGAAKARTQRQSWLDQLFALLGPATAQAAQSVQAENAPPQTPPKPQQVPKVALFDFGGEEAVAYGAALDAEGNVIIAGSVAQGKGSSLALARFTAASLYTTDAFVNQRGQTSNAVLTALPAAITRGAARCGGEIQAHLNESVTERGLVYSIAAQPALQRLSRPETPGLQPANWDRGTIASGRGYGAFIVELRSLRPATRYYVRAYAVTRGGAVLYGPQRSFTTAEACFIATAAYGGPDHPAVRLLRNFRDTMLNTHTLGRYLVDFYYRLSPPLAQAIAARPGLRLTVAALLAPMVALAWLALHPACPAALLAAPIALLMLHVARTRRRHFAGNAQGFTLIEVMVVMVILGILAALVVPRIADRPEDARRTAAAVQLRSLEQALKLYRLDNGQYPSTEQGLQALVAPPAVGKQARRWRQGGYLERGKVPKDPWGADFVYLCPGLHGEFDLISYGADNQAGGEGKNADVNNWELQ